ncbi:Eukaryotic translation initiation factor 3 subunit H [Datura stramonium]|uniref:Eukaryotic translation initiation factor 3 subunit H n=1 Tax=Datura stramonium TaxID=4076 RepID=A0ABS8V644_DATST|nr:Eukaryotic translation initiation factor 3 subunit H [Datura stramonium]
MLSCGSCGTDIGVVICVWHFVCVDQFLCVGDCGSGGLLWSMCTVSINFTCPFQTVELIETFMNYQIQPRCLSIEGLEAFRFFHGTLKSNNFTGEKLRGKESSWVDIFEEIPIKVSNSALISAFMTELEPDTPLHVMVEFRLVISKIHKQRVSSLKIYLAIASYSGLRTWHVKLLEKSYCRRRILLILPLGQLATLNDTAFITNQIATQNQINSVAGQSFSRLYLMKALHEN